MEDCKIELPVYDQNGKDTGRKIVLDNDVFCIEPNDHVLYLDIKQLQASQRQGTHKTKSRSETSHSTRKLGRQKGGGGARHGDRNANIFVGGGRALGPVPRNYSFKLNKKVRTLACKTALTYKAIEGKIVIVDELSFSKPKTQDYVRMISAFNLSTVKSSIVVPSVNDNLYLSSRNVQNSSALMSSSLNSRDVLSCDTILFTVDGLSNLISRLHN